MFSRAERMIDRSYRLHEQLGEGGMGTVYRATQMLTGRQVALKLISTSPHTGASTDSRHATGLHLSLAREFQTLASLHHPHVIRVLSYGFEDDLGPYFTMELLQAPQTLLEAAAEQSLQGKILLMAQLLRALVYVHQRGILHRDIKPGNVLVVDGAVKLLDFGIAQQGTRTADLAGTLDYLAPELLLGRPPSVQSDLYAVGVLFYQALTGAFPHSRSSLTRMLQDLLGDDSERTFPPWIAEFLAPYHTALQSPPGPAGQEEESRWQFPPDLPAALGDLGRKLLARRPEERPSAASEVLQDLAAALGAPLPLETAATRESFLQATELVGRQAELAQLEDALHAAKTGQGGGFLIGGESGVGKSRLLAELRTQALVQGFWVAEGQSTSEGTQPYQEWLPVLRDLCLRAQVSDAEAAVLKGLLPDLGDLMARPIPDLPPTSAEDALAQLSKTIRLLLRRQPKSLLLLLEDLQWGRPESLALLQSVAQSSGDLPLLLIGTYRSDEKPALPQALPALKSLPLARLQQADVARLVESMLGPLGRQASLIAYLTRQTEGNVFFLVEVVRHLAQNAGELARIGQGELPEDVLTLGMERIVGQRIARIPAEYQALLDFSAVLGRQLDLAVLSKRFAATPLQAFLMDGANAAVLESQGTTWRFAHDKLREAILRRQSAEERTTLHREVAEALESVYPGKEREPQLGALARHYSEAGIFDKALQYHREAGDVAAKLLLYEGAALHYQRALEALSRLPESPSLHREQVELLLGQVTCSLTSAPPAQTQERLAQARSLLERLQRAGQEVSRDRLQMARIDCEAGGLHTYLGQYPQAAACFDRALSIAEEFQDHSLAAKTRIMYGRKLLQEGRVARIITMLEPSLPAIERQLGGGIDVARGYSYLAMALADGGRGRAALSYLEPLQRFMDGYSESGYLKVFQLNFAPVYLSVCDFAAALRSSMQLVEGAERVNERMLGYMGWDLAAMAHCGLGDLDTALRCRQRAIELRAQWKAAFAKEWTAANHAEILLQLHRAEEACTLAAETTTSARAIGSVRTLCGAERVWGCALARLGADTTEVDAHLEESLAVAEEIGNVMEALQTEIAWAQVCLERQDRAASRVLFQKALARITEDMLPCTQDYFLPRIHSGLQRCTMEATRHVR